MIGPDERWRLQQLPLDWARDAPTRERSGCTVLIIAIALVTVAAAVVVSI